MPMISAAQSRKIRSLSQKKFRDLFGLYVAEGDKIVEELIRPEQESRDRIVQIFGTADWITRHAIALEGTVMEVTEASLNELKKVSNLVTPPPVLALVNKAHRPYDPGLFPGRTVLVFDAIRDPGNLGTSLRTADWFGIRTVVCSTDSVDVYNPKVVQAAMGALERIRVHYADLEAMLNLEELKKKAVYGTYPEGNNIYKEPLVEDCFVLFGSESHGLPARFGPLVGRRISIPSPAGNGPGPESLNLAASVAVICSEFRRRGA